MDLDLSGVLRSSRPSLEFLCRIRRGSQSLSWQHGPSVAGRLHWPIAGNRRWRRASHSTRLRRPGMGCYGSVACLEALAAIACDPIIINGRTSFILDGAFGDDVRKLVKCK